MTASAFIGFLSVEWLHCTMWPVDRKFDRPAICVHIGLRGCSTRQLSFTPHSNTAAMLVVMGLSPSCRNGCNRSTDRFADFDNFCAEHRAAFLERTLRHIDYLRIDCLNPVLKFNGFPVSPPKWRWAGYRHEDTARNKQPILLPNAPCDSLAPSDSSRAGGRMQSG